MQKINEAIRTNIFFGVINSDVSGREHQRIYLSSFTNFSEICPCKDSLFPECAVLFQKAVCIENSIVSPHQNEIDAKQAEERARTLVSEQEIVKRSQQRAVEILTAAQTQAKELSRNATVYCESILKNSEEALARSVSEIKNTRMNLRNAAARNPRSQGR